MTTADNPVWHVSIHRADGQCSHVEQGGSFPFVEVQGDVVEQARDAHRLVCRCTAEPQKIADCSQLAAIAEAFAVRDAVIASLKRQLEEDRELWAREQDRQEDESQSKR